MNVAALPLIFEPNEGQVDARAQFWARGGGFDLYLADAGALVALHRQRGRMPRPPPLPASNPDWIPHRFAPAADAAGAAAIGAEAASADDALETLVLRYRIAGASPAQRIEGIDRLPGRSNYFLGNDPAQWRTDVAQFRRVRYVGVLPGVNVVYYGNGGQVEFDVEVAPGVDLADVRVRVDGAESLSLDADGDLTIHTQLGDLTQRKPVVYQTVAGERRELRGGYVLLDHAADGAHEFAFAVTGYDRALALVLDPTLAASFLIGGNGPDTGTAVASDASGNWYLTGYSGSSNFPTSVGAYQTTNKGSTDVFVYKVSNDGATMLYSTLIGGGGQDTATGIGVDANGNAYVSGNTLSANFPTVNALQGTNPGNLPGFVAALNASGNGLIYSTYLGGNNLTAVNGIAVDPGGDAYVTGYTLATNLLTTAGAFQPSTAGQYSAFVFKFDPAGGEVFGTYLVDDFNNSGFGADRGQAIAIDDEGNSYVTGYTSSTIWGSYNGVAPARIGPGGGSYDMLLARLNNTGTWLDWATLIGGSATDEATAISVDASHQVFLAGWSASPDLSPNTGQSSNDWLWLGHVDETGTQLLDAAWLGAAGANVFPQSLVQDAAHGYVALAGHVGNPASLSALNPLANDCGNACTGAGTNGGLFATYLFDANGLMQPDSVTRIVGVGGAGQTLLNGIALAPESAANQAFTNGVSDGTPPSAVVAAATSPAGGSMFAPQAPLSGNHAYGAAINGAGIQQPVLPPVITKRFEAPNVEPGHYVRITILVTNPNAQSLAGYFNVADSLPGCLGPVRTVSVQSPNVPGLNKYYGPSGTGFAVDNASADPFTQGLPPNSTVTITFAVEATSSGGTCENTAGLSSSKGNAQAKASLEIRSVPRFTWTGGGPDTLASDANNWDTMASPLPGDDVVFPTGPAKTAVNNDLPATQPLNAIDITGGGYTIGGNALNLLYGLGSAAANNTVSAPIRFLAPAGFVTSDPAASSLLLSGGMTLNGTSATFSGAGSANINSVISGTGDVIFLGTGSVAVNATPTFTGGLFAGGGTVTVNVYENEPLDIFGNGVVRACTSPNTCGDITVDDQGDFHPCTGATPCNASVNSLTCNGSRIELDCGANNTPCTNIVSSGPVVSTCDELTFHLQNTPIVGTTFNDVITGSSNSGCPENVYATPASVELAAQCTATAVSLVTRAVDAIFHNGF